VIRLCDRLAARGNNLESGRPTTPKFAIACDFDADNSLNATISKGFRLGAGGAIVEQCLTCKARLAYY
jgi:hypothetical protein